MKMGTSREQNGHTNLFYFVAVLAIAHPIEFVMCAIAASLATNYLT